MSHHATDPIIGLLIIAHSPLASALAQAACHIYTCAPDMAQEKVAIFDVAPDTDIQAAIAEARRLATQVDSGQGVLVLTDVLGATPSNIASHLLDDPQRTVLAGLNLPMLLRSLSYRTRPLAEATAKTLEGGIQGAVQMTRSPAPPHQP